MILAHAHLDLQAGPGQTWLSLLETCIVSQLTLLDGRQRTLKCQAGYVPAAGETGQGQEQQDSEQEHQQDEDEQERFRARAGRGGADGDFDEASSSHE